jgi:hypothetical protein
MFEIQLYCILLIIILITVYYYYYINDAVFYNLKMISDTNDKQTLLQEK